MYLLLCQKVEALFFKYSCNVALYVTVIYTNLTFDTGYKL